MIFSILDQLQDNPQAAIAFLAAVIVALGTGLVFHEFCHAWSAYQLGDDTAARQGRLTLNPLKHLDPVGSAMMLIIGFGWARPTPVNVYRLRYGPVRGGAIVSAAGPLSNFVIAAMAALPLKLGVVDGISNLDALSDARGSEIVGVFLFFLALYNVLLGVFNLIPIPPLDGFAVLQPVLPRAVRQQLAGLQQWGPALLIGLFVISFATQGRINPIGNLFRPFVDFVFRFLS